MFIVAGANLFLQWISKDVIISKFTLVSAKPPVPTKLDLQRVRIICIAWSYNVIQINDEYMISGALDDQDDTIKKINLPDECVEHSKLLISGNDYNIIVIDTNTNSIWVYDLKTKTYKKVLISENTNTDNTSNILPPYNIVKVLTANNNCVYLTSCGKIFVGVLPSYIDTTHCIGKVCDVQCGYEHYILLTDDGRVYSWGNGRRLQLGHGNIDNLDIPTEIEALAGIKIVKIRAGGWHSLALSEWGDLYVWGWNNMGQLGKIVEGKETVEDSSGVPTLIDLYEENGTEVNSNVKDIACGTKHSVILLEDNTVWTTGCNKYGQLGFPPEQYEKIYGFKKSFNAPENAEIMCGPWCTVVIY